MHFSVVKSEQALAAMKRVQTQMSKMESTTRRYPRIQPPDSGKHDAEKAPQNEKKKDR